MADRIHRETNLVLGDVIRDIIWEYHISVRVPSLCVGRHHLYRLARHLRGRNEPQAMVSHLPAHEVEKQSEGRKQKDTLSRHAIGDCATLRSTVAGRSHLSSLPHLLLLLRLPYSSFAPTNRPLRPHPPPVAEAAPPPLGRTATPPPIVSRTVTPPQPTLWLAAVSPSNNPKP
jgi:hypothetical protein